MGTLPGTTTKIILQMETKECLKRQVLDIFIPTFLSFSPSPLLAYSKDNRRLPGEEAGRKEEKEDGIKEVRKNS